MTDDRRSSISTVKTHSVTLTTEDAVSSYHEHKPQLCMGRARGKGRAVGEGGEGEGKGHQLWYEAAQPSSPLHVIIVPFKLLTSSAVPRVVPQHIRWPLDTVPPTHHNQARPPLGAFARKERGHPTAQIPRGSSPLGVHPTQLGSDDALEAALLRPPPPPGCVHPTHHDDPPGPLQQNERKHEVGCVLVGAAGEVLGRVAGVRGGQGEKRVRRGERGNGQGRIGIRC